MEKLSHKLLAASLALLLALSPIQSVLASLVTPSDDGNEIHQMAEMHGDMGTKSVHENTNCDQCSYENGCADHDCSSSQCAYSALAILPDYLFLTNYSDRSLFNPLNRILVNRVNPSLFRPPRV